MTNSNQIVSHIYTGNSLTLVYKDVNGDYQTKIVESSHLNWRPILAAYKARDFQKVILLADVRAAINSKFQGVFKIEDDVVTYNGEPVHGLLFDLIIQSMREGLPYKHLVNFANNLYQNPSSRSREELFTFLAHKNMPICEDGCFLAYRGIQSDWYSKHGGTINVLKGKVNAQGQIFNGVGEDIEVERGQVDDNFNNGCSRGLHVGSHKYASEWAGSNGRVIVIKVNPRDAVSVPSDCSFQKLRACAYKVVSEDSRLLSDVKDINYDKNPNTTPDAFDEAIVEAYETGWDDGWNEGVEDRENPVLNGTAESATGPQRDNHGRFVSAGSQPKRDSLGRFTS